MNSNILPGAILALLITALLIGAQSSTAQEESDTAMHMHEHLLRLTDIKTALINGDLDGVREPADWLANHEPLPDLPLIFEPFVLDMRAHAGQIVEAGDLATASAGVSAIARDCASCHMAAGIDLKFGFDEAPPGWSDLQTHMQRHLWAVDRLWEGLIGPSDASWSRGVTMLAEAPLLGTEAAWDEEEAHGDELAIRVHQLGRNAASALTPEARSSVYGNLLGACAECHKQTGGGPGAR